MKQLRGLSIIDYIWVFRKKIFKDVIKEFVLKIKELAYKFI
jgi:hypothetical protein